MMLLDSENENSDEQFDEPLVKIFVEELGEDQILGQDLYRFDVIERGLQSAALESEGTEKLFIRDLNSCMTEICKQKEDNNKKESNEDCDHNDDQSGQGLEQYELYKQIRQLECCKFNLKKKQFKRLKFTELLESDNNSDSIIIASNVTYFQLRCLLKYLSSQYRRFNGLLMREIKLIQYYDKHVAYQIDNHCSIDYYNIELKGEKDEMFYVKIVEFQEMNTSMILAQNDRDMNEVIKVYKQCYDLRELKTIRSRTNATNKDSSAYFWSKTFNNKSNNTVKNAITNSPDSKQSKFQHNESQIVPYDGDKSERLWGESNEDSLSMISEEEYILSTNDFTFMIINHAILKFEPMIIDFQKEIDALEAHLWYDTAVDLKKDRYDYSRRMFYA